MRRIRYHEYGEPEVLQIEEVPRPIPAVGEVVITTDVIGTSYIDTVMRQGANALGPRQLPGSPHGDVVGRIDSVGPGVTRVAPGDRVAAFISYDAYAEQVVAPVDWLVRVPDGVADEVASALPMPGPVALGTLRAGRLGRGETVVVHSAAGGIGQLAVQLARLEGAGTVIATAGSASKLDLARELGADAAISYAEDDWADQVRELAPGGVDVVLDSVGGQVSTDSLRLLAPLGRVVAYGMSGRRMPSYPPDELAMRTVTGFAIMGWRAARPAAAAAEVAELAEHARAGRLRVPVHARVSLDEAPRAHRLLQDRTRVGRVLIVP